MGEGPYQLDGVTLYHSSFDETLLDNPKVILDVGAYDFGDGIRFKRRFPDCQVLGVEMSKDNYGKFHEFANKQGIKTFNLAICDKNEKVGYFQSTCTLGINAQSTILEPGQVYKNAYNHIVKHDTEKIWIDGKTLDTLAEENNITEVDFLHLDVEGAEYHVFLGMKKIRPKLIFAEFLFDGGWVGQASWDETFKLLDSYGYELLMDLPHDKIFKLKEEKAE